MNAQIDQFFLHWWFTGRDKHLSKTNFYKVKLGFKGVIISFHISALKNRLLVLLGTISLFVLVGTASRSRLKRVPTIYVLSKNKKNVTIFHLRIVLLQS